MRPAVSPTIVAVAVLAACTSAPLGGGGGYLGGTGTDTGSGQDAGSTGNTPSGRTGSGGSTGSSSATDASSSTGSTKDSSSTGSGSSTSKCFGNFSLTSTPFSSNDTSQIGAKCNGTVPKNCPDGLSLTFKDDGTCVCIISCAPGPFQGGIKLGENCSKDGKWKCLEIVSDGGSNKAKACVNTAWDLCTTGSTGSTGGNTGTGTADAGSTGGSTGSKDTSSGGGGTTCTKAKSGQECTFDSDCCSGKCILGDDVCM